MKRLLKEWVSRVRPLISSPRFVVDCLVSGLMLIVFGLGIMYWVLEPLYATVPERPLNDRLLAILPTVNLNIPSAYLLYFTVGLFTVYSLWKMPEKLPFILKIFTVMAFAKHLIGPITNLSQPSGAVRDWAYDNIYNDLFFSGHTANTFFCYLITRKGSKRFKFLFLAISAFEATAVLLMKLHYTIDVFSAPFIAFGIFRGMGYLLRNEKTRYEGLLPKGADICPIA